MEDAVPLLETSPRSQVPQRRFLQSLGSGQTDGRVINRTPRAQEEGHMPIGWWL